MADQTTRKMKSVSTSSFKRRRPIDAATEKMRKMTLDSKRDSKESISTPVTPAKTSPRSGDIDLENFILSCRKIYNKPFESLPVHKDLARLIKGAIIQDNSNIEKPLLFYYGAEEREKLDRFEACREFLAVLSERLDSAQQTEWIRNNFPMDTEHKDFEVQLGHFLTKLRSTQFPLKALALIKCCNQEIPYAAIMLMKNIIGSKFGYKDVRGTWKISIIFDKGKVTVNHHKIEQSIEESQDKWFRFEWRLSFRFNEDLSSFIPQLQIMDFQFGRTMSDELQKEVTKTFMPVMGPATPYFLIWKRTLTNSPDLQLTMNQFAHKVVVTNMNGKKLWAPDKTLKESENIRDLVVFLGQILGEPQSYIDEFLKAINSKNREVNNKLVESQTKNSQANSWSGIGKSVDSPLITSNDSDIPSSRLWAVLKCLSNDIAKPAIMKMRESFYQKIQFSDVRGSWTIHLKIDPDQPVTVIHRKQEESPDKDFFFEWVLVITLDMNFKKLDKVEFRINDYGFAEKTLEETRRLVKSCLKPFYLPKDNVAVAMEPDAILQAVIERLKESPRICAHHPDLPHSLDISYLLTHLRLQLRGESPPIGTSSLPCSLRRGSINLSRATTTPVPIFQTTPPSSPKPNTSPQPPSSPRTSVIVSPVNPGSPFRSTSVRTQLRFIPPPPLLRMGISIPWQTSSPHLPVVCSAPVLPSFLGDEITPEAPTRSEEEGSETPTEEAVVQEAGVEPNKVGIDSTREPEEEAGIDNVILATQPRVELNENT